jgi:hypothetical protein
VQLSIRLTELDEKFWSQDPQDINASIANLFDRLRTSQAESQWPNGILFKNTSGKYWEIDESNPSDDIDLSPAAHQRHHQCVSKIKQAIDLCKNHNQANALVSDLEEWLPQIGEHPSDMKTGMVINQGDLCADLMLAMIGDLGGDIQNPDLPFVTAKVVAVLNAVIKSWNYLIELDPKLSSVAIEARKVTELPKPMLSVGAINLFFQKSVGIGLLSAKAGDTMIQMNNNLLPSNDKPSSAKSGFWESIRNFPRAVISWLWEQRVNISANLKQLSKAKNWIDLHHDFIVSLFSYNPVMIDLISEIYRWLDALPNLLS